MAGEGLDEAGADAAAAEGWGQVDVQVGRELPAHLGELGAEIADIGEPLLQGRILHGAHQIAGNRILALQGKEQGVAAASEVAAEPAFAESVALPAGGKGARAGLEEDRIDLLDQGRREPVGLGFPDYDVVMVHGRERRLGGSPISTHASSA